MALKFRGYDMDEQQGQASRSRRPSGRDAKRAARTARSAAFVPYITRKIPYYEVLGTEGLELLEHNAETILQEIGIDFRDDPEALQLLKEAGADIQAERARSTTRTRSCSRSVSTSGTTRKPCSS